MRGRFRGCVHNPFIDGDILIPATLVILMNKPTYGYSLIEELRGFGIDISLFHPSVIYRILRAMEIEGLVTSSWDIKDIGPARRVYSITDIGKSFLKTWVMNAKENLKIVEKIIKTIEGGDKNE